MATTKKKAVRKKNGKVTKKSADPPHPSGKANKAVGGKRIPAGASGDPTHPSGGAVPAKPAP